MAVYENIVGRKYGLLTVMGEVQKTINGRKRYFVECICDCGNNTLAEKSHIKSGQTKSCGCTQVEMRKDFGKRVAKAVGEAAFNETYGQYRKGARMRGYAFDLTKEQFREISTQPCIYCGEALTQEKVKRDANGTFKYTGIDRYDNTKGYTLDNAVPCCCKCNRIKTDMSIEEMERRLTKIVARKNFWFQTA